MGGAQQEPPHYCPMREEGRTEAPAAGGGRVEVGVCDRICSYGDPLVTVTSFYYLGRTLAAMYDDWLEVVGNLQKARQTWV